MAGSSRERFEMRLDRRPRDRRIAEWIDLCQAEGRDAGELIKNILDEIITGHSSITGRPIVGQAETLDQSQGPAETDAVAQALDEFED